MAPVALSAADGKYGDCGSFCGIHHNTASGAAFVLLWPGQPGTGDCGIRGEGLTTFYRDMYGFACLSTRQDTNYGRIDEVDRKKKINQKWMIRSIAGFLIVMAAGGVISRAAASMLIAQVGVEKVGRGKLSYSYDGNGTVVTVQQDQLFLWPEQQVEWVADPGSTVKAGERLVQFRKEYLQQSIDKKQAELNQLELQVSQQQVSAREPARVPATTGAGHTLSEAQLGLQTAQQKAAEAEAAYNQFINSPVPDGEEDDVAAKMQELEAALQEANAEVQTAQQAVNQAQNAYELARQEDAAQNTNAANAAQAALLGAEAAQVQVEQARKELERLLSYQAADGKICAVSDCTVLQVGVQAGAVTTGSEIFVTGSGGFQLKGMVKAEDKEKLKVGAEVGVQLAAGKKKTVKIESIGMETGETAGAGSGDDAAGQGASSMQTFWRAPLPENTNVGGGEQFTWSIETSSEKEYDQIIPLSALREDANEAYCLVLSEEDRMLGTLQTAKRVPVTVLEKDAKSAAITSTLTNTDQVIVSSEKYVVEGDRVRLKE